MSNEVSQIAEAIIPEEFKKCKFFSVMLFYTGHELGLPENDWINTKNLCFSDYLEALNAYVNIPCPASQLIQAETKEQLEKEIQQMRANFQNELWLEENLYPYL